MKISPAELARGGDPIAQADELVAIARQYDAVAPAALDQRAQLAGHLEDEVLLVEAVHRRGAGIDAAVPGVEHHHRPVALARPAAGGACPLTWAGDGRQRRERGRPGRRDRGGTAARRGRHAAAAAAATAALAAGRRRRRLRHHVDDQAMKRAVLVRRQEDAVDDAHGPGQRHRQGRVPVGASRSRSPAPGRAMAGRRRRQAPCDFAQLDDQPVRIGLDIGGEAHLAVEIEHDPGAGAVLAEAQARRLRAAPRPAPGAAIQASHRISSRTTATDRRRRARGQAVRPGGSTLGCRPRFISLAQITRLWMRWDSYYSQRRDGSGLGENCARSMG